MESGARIHIYIVEDDKLFSELMKNLVAKLENDFHKKDVSVKLIPHAFKSIDDAGAFLKEIPPDIVLLDYYLVDKNKRTVTSDAFLKKLLSNDPHVKVIIVSGESKKNTVHRLKEIGAAFFISKQPKTIHRIVPALKMIIEKKLEDE